MSLLFSFFALLFGFLPGLVLANFQGAQSKANETVANSDINSIYQKLEEHYNENGEYPTVKELSEEYDQQLPGIDAEALKDADGKFINEDGSDYTYTPENCTAVGCEHYTLSATLDDGSSITKSSLN
jgi:type II secretory pathway pseudopilin PulG